MDKFWVLFAQSLAADRLRQLSGHFPERSSTVLSSFSFLFPHVTCFCFIATTCLLIYFLHAVHSGGGGRLRRYTAAAAVSSGCKTQRLQYAAAAVTVRYAAAAAAVRGRGGRTRRRGTQRQYAAAAVRGGCGTWQLRYAAVAVRGRCGTQRLNHTAAANISYIIWYLRYHTYYIYIYIYIAYCLPIDCPWCTYASPKQIWARDQDPMIFCISWAPWALVLGPWTWAHIYYG